MYNRRVQKNMVYGQFSTFLIEKYNISLPSTCRSNFITQVKMGNSLRANWSDRLPEFASGKHFRVSSESVHISCSRCCSVEQHLSATKVVRGPMRRDTRVERIVIRVKSLHETHE